MDICLTLGKKRGNKTKLDATLNQTLKLIGSEERPRSQESMFSGSTRKKKKHPRMDNSRGEMLLLRLTPAH